MQHLPDRPKVKPPRKTRRDRYDPEVVARAYELFLEGEEDFATVALQLNVPHRDVLYWARKEKWLERKEELTRTLELGAEQDYRRFLAESRLPTAERHLRIAKNLEELIESELSKLDADGEAGAKDRTAALRRLSEALASAANISARAAGITDRPAPIESAQSQQQRRPLIMIGVNPTVSPDKHADEKVIDVEDYTTEETEDDR